MRPFLLSLALTLLPSTALGEDGDLRLHRLSGPLTTAGLRTLRQALDSTHANGEVLLLEIDSPGGSLALGQNSMIAILFSGAPVVAYVPPGGRASGSATLVLMAAGIIAAAPDARLGTSNGLGNEVELRLGPFGTRLLDAAQASRSAAVDWLVVSLADGSELDGRSAHRRGVVAHLAPDAHALARRLAGKSVPVPLTGERSVVSGRIAGDPVPLVRRAAEWVASPLRAVPLLLLGILLLAVLPATRPTPRLVSFAGALVAATLGAMHDLPLGAVGPVCGALAFLAAWGAPHLGRWAALAVAPLAAIAAATWIDPTAPGHYLAAEATPTFALSAVAGIVLAGCVILVSRGRRTETRREAGT